MTSSLLIITFIALGLLLNELKPEKIKYCVSAGDRKDVLSYTAKPSRS